MNRDHAGPCHIITQTEYGPSRRCLEENGHNGPHWSNAEPLPDGCPCDSLWCGCPSSAQVSAGARFEIFHNSTMMVCNNCEQDVAVVVHLDEAVRAWNDHECHQAYTTLQDKNDDGMKEAIEQLRKKLKGQPGNLTSHVHSPVARRSGAGPTLYVCDCGATRPIGRPDAWTESST